MSDARRAQDHELQKEIVSEDVRGGTFWRDHLAKVGRARIVDQWTAIDVATALREINLNRWRGDLEVQAAAREARAAAARLSAVISRSEKLR